MNTAEQSKTLSLMMLTQRIILALAFIFLALGETLHLHAFVQNAIDIGLPFARILCTAAVIITFIAALFIILGLFFRTSSIVMTVLTLFSGFFFFAGSFNKVNIVGTLFALALLAGFIINGMGLCTIYIGISGAFEGENTLVAVISMAAGAVIGLAIGIDRRVNSGVEKLEKRFIKKPQEDTAGASFTEGFVTASMIFCVGAMTILGSLQAGLTGDNTTLFTKATMDGIGAIFFAASLGFGVLAAGIFVFVFQGAIVMLAQFIEPFFCSNV